MMKKLCMPVVFALAAFALPVLLAKDDPPGAKPDTDALARKLVGQCARVKDGDVVRITGRPHDVELLEALTVEAARLGADTLLTLAPSDRTSRRLYTDVPAKFDARVSRLGLKLAETVTVTFALESAESDATLADIPAERIHARTAAEVNLQEAHLKRNVRQVSVGNGLYPTEARAKQYGLSKAELAKLFYDGLNVDYDRMQATGEAMRKSLAGGRKVHITTPEGTDLTVEVASRPVFVSDGVLTDDKVKKGGAACQTWLPAGEVYLAPVAGTADGKVVAERQLWEGKEVRGLTLTVKKGKVTEMQTKSGGERLRAMYDAAGAGRDEFSAIDVGINPAVRLPRSSPAGLYMEAGTISVNLGNNAWAGGDNKCAFGLPVFLRGGTLRVDGTAVVQDGSLQILH